MNKNAQFLVSPDGAKDASLAQGVVLAVMATLTWGLFPLAFKAVAHISALEVLAHRSFWTFIFATLLMVIFRRREIFSRSLYTRRILSVAALSGVTIAVNWGVFIWAVANDHVLQTSLGYYISPLLSVLLGVVVLKERLTLRQWIALGFAVLGVLFMGMNAGASSWVVFAIAGSWTLYGFVRKLAPVGSLPGLYLETLMLLPISLGYIVWLLWGTTSAAFGSGVSDSLLLIFIGALTAFPLLLFARAARVLPLSALGLLMYIVPTGQFLLAVFAFHEPFTQKNLMAFVLIWVGLALYSWDTFTRHRARRRAPVTRPL